MALLDRGIGDLEALGRNLLNWFVGSCWDGKKMVIWELYDLVWNIWRCGKLTGVWRFNVDLVEEFLFIKGFIGMRMAFLRLD